MLGLLRRFCLQLIIVLLRSMRMEVCVFVSAAVVEEMKPLKTLQIPAKTGTTKYIKIHQNTTNGCRYEDTNFHSHG